MREWSIDRRGSFDARPFRVSIFCFAALTHDVYPLHFLKTAGAAFRLMSEFLPGRRKDDIVIDTVFFWV